MPQYYFETIFPRIPKPVADDLAAKLTEAGLPGKAIGNGGQGGGDRRGIEEAGRRPASVKVLFSPRNLLFFETRSKRPPPLRHLQTQGQLDTCVPAATSVALSAPISCRLKLVPAVHLSQQLPPPHSLCWCKTRHGLMENTFSQSSTTLSWPDFQYSHPAAGVAVGGDGAARP